MPLPLRQHPALLPGESGWPRARVRCPHYTGPRGLPADSHPLPCSSSAAAGVTVPGGKLRLCTATASSLPSLLASSSHPTCLSALCCSDCISEQQCSVPLTAAAPVPSPKSSPLQQEMYKEPQQPWVMASQPGRTLPPAFPHLFCAGHTLAAGGHPLWCLQAWLWDHHDPKRLWHCRSGPCGQHCHYQCLDCGLASDLQWLWLLPRCPHWGWTLEGPVTVCVRGWDAEPRRTQHPGSLFVVGSAIGCLAVSLS